MDDPEKQHKSQIGRRCVYFTGILTSTCKAGVLYASVRVSDGKPYPYPCLILPQATAKQCGRLQPPDNCTSRHFPTAEEIEAEYKADMECISKAFGALNAGFCPVCNNPIEPTRKDGRCIYAACGHRLGNVGEP